MPLLLEGWRLNLKRLNLHLIAAQELFGQLQEEMESCATQIGRKTEQLRILEEDILSLEKKVREIEIEIEKLYEKHNVSKEKSDFINECDAIVGLLNQFIVRMRKSNFQF